MKQKIFVLFLFLLFSSESLLYAHVGIDYPKGGENFNTGDVLDIKWHVEIDHGPCQWDLYFSTNTGSTWEPIITGIPKTTLDYKWTIPDSLANTQCAIQVVQNNSQYAQQSDASGKFSISETVSGIVSENAKVKKFTVYPAYPNPFNNSTVISFSLPQNANVELSIYNITGQKIATLINTNLEEGEHNITWNADNVSSGVYLYVIKTDLNAQTRKLILLK
jgi:Secretion system C-terminal sorting domain/Kre9/KNH-like N-terminal Ig-like domain